MPDDGTFDTRRTSYLVTVAVFFFVIRITDRKIAQEIFPGKETRRTVVIGSLLILIVETGVEIGFVIFGIALQILIQIIVDFCLDDFRCLFVGFIDAVD